MKSKVAGGVLGGCRAALEMLVSQHLAQISRGHAAGSARDPRG